MKYVGKHKYETTDDCSSTAVTDDLFMHSSLPPATKHIQVIKLNYKKRWNLHKNSQTVKKSCGPCKKRQHEKSCEIRGGCDGRIMENFLMTTIQVNLVPIPWRRQHKFAWIGVIKHFAIIIPSQLLLGRYLYFFMLSFLHTPHLFLQFGCFCVDTEISCEISWFNLNFWFPSWFLLT